MAQTLSYLDPIDDGRPEAEHMIDPDQTSLKSYRSDLTDSAPDSIKKQPVEERKAHQQELPAEWNRPDMIGKDTCLQSSSGSSRPLSPQSQCSSPTSDSPPHSLRSSRSSESVSELQGAKSLPNPLRSHPVRKAPGLGGIHPFQIPQDPYDSDDPDDDDDNHFGPWVRGSHGAISALTLTGDLDTFYHGRTCRQKPPYQPTKASNTELHSPCEDAFDRGAWASSCSDVQPMPVSGVGPTGASDPSAGESEEESVHCTDWAAVREEQHRTVTVMPDLREEEEDNNSETGDPAFHIPDDQVSDSDEAPEISTAKPLQQSTGVSSSDATYQGTSERVKRVGSWKTEAPLDESRREYQADEREDDSSSKKDPGSSSPSWLRSIVSLPSRCLKSLTSSLSHLNPLTRARELFSIVARTSRSRHTEAGTSLAKDRDQSSGALDNDTASPEGRQQSPLYSQTSVVNSCLHIHRLG